jgi:hypothetical protein
MSRAHVRALAEPLARCKEVAGGNASRQRRTRASSDMTVIGTAKANAANRWSSQPTLALLR